MGPVILPYRNILPRIDPSAFIAPGAIVIGDVEIGPFANIWFNCVIRGDDAPIRIGAGANIQDGTIVHVTFEKGEHIECVIGEAAATATYRSADFPSLEAMIDAFRGEHAASLPGPVGAASVLRRNLLIYGLGGIVVPFIGIKLIDIAVTATGLA